MRVLTVVALLALSAQGPVDLLGLAGAHPGPGLPPGWKVRRIRNRAAPAAEVREDGGGRLLRLEGAGQAAWFYGEPARPITETPGSLRWSWRVLEGPPDADLTRKATDDSPIRVYVVFGNPRPILGGSGRVIFYSFGNAEAEGYHGPSHAGDRYHIIRVDGPAGHAAWRYHAVDPFADYRRIWRRTPPPITAVGVMQDTDQTGQRATAEVRLLEWVPGPKM